MNLLPSPWDDTASAEKTAAASPIPRLAMDVLALNGSLRATHWQASSKDNTHEALGKLYEGLDGKLDDLVETYMGIARNRTLAGGSFPVKANRTPAEIVDALKAKVTELLEACKQESYDDLANISADMLAEVNHTAFLLEL